MYSDIPFWASLVFIAVGFLALAWSSDAFVDGAATIAKALGVSPFIIGMVIIGFGTSAPEVCVSVMSSYAGHSNLALGNAYGSDIVNIAVILGISAIVNPIVVKTSVSFVAAPILIGVTLFSMYVLRDGVCGRMEACMLLIAFAIIMPLYCWYDQRQNPKHEVGTSAPNANGSIWIALVKLIVGLGVLVGSSHILVWGCVDVARVFGVSELVIGLTIVAIGTSLPELASSIASARRREHEFVLGNIIGSNLFNTLAVVGLSGIVSPIRDISPFVLTRDLPMVLAATLAIPILGINWKNIREDGVWARLEGGIMVALFIAYTVVMIVQES